MTPRTLQSILVYALIGGMFGFLIVQLAEVAHILSLIAAKLNTVLTVPAGATIH